MANKCEIIFIIEFQPAGFFPFKGLDQNEITDKIMPFSLIDYYLDAEMKKVLKTLHDSTNTLDSICDKLGYYDISIL